MNEEQPSKPDLLPYAGSFTRGHQIACQEARDGMVITIYPVHRGVIIRRVIVFALTCSAGVVTAIFALLWWKWSQLPISATRPPPFWKLFREVLWRPALGIFATITFGGTVGCIMRSGPTTVALKADGIEIGCGFSPPGYTSFISRAEIGDVRAVSAGVRIVSIRGRSLRLLHVDARADRRWLATSLRHALWPERA